jgi:hypothetical protein
MFYTSKRVRTDRFQCNFFGHIAFLWFVKAKASKELVNRHDSNSMPPSGNRAIYFFLNKGFTTNDIFIYMGCLMRCQSFIINEWFEYKPLKLDPSQPNITVLQ